MGLTKFSSTNLKMRKEKGASSVEFAIILPILTLLLLGIIQFGIAYNSYLVITHAAREGARLAAVGNYTQAEVIGRASPPLDEDKLIVEINPSGGQAPYREPVTVTVSYPIAINLPFIPGAPFRFNLTSRATMYSETSGL